ncbi:uncharacterized protein B0J16DRAFT_324280 [Fusarium flagelliforme]|uniref:uncharacterized protein n=1 Tax=Fusarium flagelliforme TaxID=2675880 RepID=UPI001E8CB0BB|nr:uncharacterized protein B0J16DRAFT_324280 [Fusarium flagelliforme]KAH7174820.1 hypothetical protein B0J16DRAFT_324280 [Fusarium flagelliforme]
MAVPDPDPSCPGGTPTRFLCLTILGYRRSDLSEEQYRRHMINISAPMTTELMAKYGIKRWNMVVFKSIDDYKRIKEDPWYKEHLVRDHEKFANTKRSRMTIGWITEFIRDGEVVDGTQDSDKAHRKLIDTIAVIRPIDKRYFMSHLIHIAGKAAPPTLPTE